MKQKQRAKITKIGGEKQQYWNFSQKLGFQEQKTPEKTKVRKYERANSSFKKSNDKKGK